MIYRYFSVFILAVFSCAISAEPIHLVFQGIVDNDPNDSFTLDIRYSSEATDFTSGQDCCGQYGPMSLVLTHGNESLSILDARLNVDNIPSQTFEGIQWVDQGQPWSGTFLGQGVQSGAINFGNFGPTYVGDRSRDLPLSVDLDEWEYHNGIFVQANGAEIFVDLLVQLFDTDQDGVFDDACSGTDANAVVDASGCSVAQHCPAGAFRNQGQRLSCAARTGEDFVQQGLITGAEKGQIVSGLARRS